MKIKVKKDFNCYLNETEYHELKKGQVVNVNDKDYRFLVVEKDVCEHYDLKKEADEKLEAEETARKEKLKKEAEAEKEKAEKAKREAEKEAEKVKALELKKLKAEKLKAGKLKAKK